MKFQNTKDKEKMLGFQRENNRFPIKDRELDWYQASERQFWKLKDDGERFLKF